MQQIVQHKTQQRKRQSQIHRVQRKAQILCHIVQYCATSIVAHRATVCAEDCARHNTTTEEDAEPDGRSTWSTIWRAGVQEIPTGVKYRMVGSSPAVTRHTSQHGTTLRQLSNSCEITLGQHKDNFGIVLSHRREVSDGLIFTCSDTAYFSAVDKLWDDFEMNFEQPWDNFGTTLGQLWDSFEPPGVKYRMVRSSLAVTRHTSQLWDNFGTKFEQLW